MNYTTWDKEHVKGAGGREYYANGRKYHKFDDVRLKLTGLDLFKTQELGSLLRIGLAGQGGSGKVGDNAGSGASGAQLIDIYTPMLPDFYSVTLGTGGVGTDDSGPGQDGGNTEMFGFTAHGGKGAARANNNGLDGFSGSGAAAWNKVGGKGVKGQGYNGGNTSSSITATAGGAGAGGPGQDSQPNDVGGNGGPGRWSDLDGTWKQYCAGAGGSSPSQGGLGGAGGGGNGGTGYGAPTGGENGTGSGGGSQWAGSSYGQNTGRGGDGIAVVSYPWSGPEIKYGVVVETLNSNISGMIPRDSAEYIPFGNGKWGLFGGWNNDVWSGSNQTAEWWTTEDFINFTQEDDLPYKIDHAVGEQIGDYTYLMAFSEEAYWVSMKIHTTTKAVTIINSNIGGTGGSLENLKYAYWGFAVGGVVYIAVTTDTDPNALRYVKLYKSSDYDTFTYVCDLPDYMIRSNTFVSGTNAFIGSGGEWDGSYSGPNYIDSIYKFDTTTDTLSVHCAIDPEMRGLWGRIGRINDTWIFIRGFVYEDGSDPADIAWREGSIHYSVDDGQNWRRTYDEEFLTEHAKASIVVGNTMYLACGHLSNTSHKITFNF